MAVLHAVAWPPDPLTTERLVLRQTQASDRAGYIELLCSGAVRRYQPGHLLPKATRARGELQLLPEHWGKGLAAEAVNAVVGWARTRFPGEPIIVCT